MPTKKLRSIKGRVARITRLDECGAPVFGACSVVTTEGFITVTISEENEAGEEYTQKNAWGEFCINEKDPDLTKWANVMIEFCEVDPDILDIVGGANPVVSGSGDTIGATFGPAAPTGAFAIEVWTKKAGTSNCVGGVTEWGYFTVPYVKNGKLDGDVKIENGPMSVSFKGEGYGAPAEWGVGPHGDYPMKSVAGFPVGDFWGMVVTDVQPPAATTGCATLVVPPNKAAVEPGDVFPAEPTITAQDETRALLLTGLGFIADLPGTSWTIGEFFTVGTFQFSWTGIAWHAGVYPDKANVTPGDYFAAEATITAESAPMAALLAGLGYVVDVAPAWTTGQFFAVGLWRFNWSGSAWAAGPHA